MPKLRDNKWGYDLHLDNPFRIFRHLREVADESVGVENVVDLSRGDPGYGFSPSVRGREFYAFLIRDFKQAAFVLSGKSSTTKQWNENLKIYLSDLLKEEMKFYVSCIIFLFLLIIIKLSGILECQNLNKKYKKLRELRA